MGPRICKLIGLKLVPFATGCLVLIALLVTPAWAQHGDWLMGTNGLQSAQQFPEGVFYSNVWSYYHASGSDFAETGPVKCGPRDRVCLSLNLGGNGSLDQFVDQNIVGWTTPYQFWGAHYGLLVDIPFAIVDANGSANVEPVLSLRRRTFALQSIQRSGETTKGGIGNIYVEPVNLGWHFRQLDAVVSSGFFAPSGPYNSHARVNIGFGHWTGVFGLGGILYADAERTWSLSISTHYLLYGSQMGRNYTLGDVVPFEWGASKSINFNNDIVKQFTVGAVGYAQWQVTNNQIDLTPTTKIGARVINTLENANSQIYSAGPAFNLLTKYGLYSLRYYEEFGANATPSGQQLMFSVALAFGGTNNK
ncbi:MAG: SphA family protein [Terriglobia bacterium]